MSDQISPQAASSSLLTPPKFPRIEYQSKPVITTDLLAKAYGTETVRVRTNFNKNKSRFVPGKHFFTVSGNDLKELSDAVSLRNGVNDGVLMPQLRGPSVTLYTKHGAALHAKMLNTDTAWELYEAMVDHYFDSTEAKALTAATKEERRPLVDAVRTWVRLAGADYSLAHRQVNAVVGVSSVEQMTNDQVDTALAWVRQRIDAIAKATETKAIAAADDVLVDIERFSMILKKAREACKGLPPLLEVSIIRHFLKKAGYLVGE